MAPAKKETGRKYAARMRKLRVLRKERKEEAQRLETQQQTAILLKTLSRIGIV